MTMCVHLKDFKLFNAARVRDLEIQTQVWKNSGDDNPQKKARAALRMQQALITAQELGDEKMNILQNILDKIEIKTRLLDQDFKNLDFGKDETPSTVNKEQQQPPVSNTSSGTSMNNSERPSKRARRTRQDTFSGLESNTNENSTDHVLRSQVTNNSAATQKKTNTGNNGCVCTYVVVKSVCFW